MNDSEYKLSLEAGIVLKERGDFECALEKFSSLIELCPKRLQGYLEIGDTYRRLGNISTAIAWLSRAAEIDRRNFWPYYLRADIMSQGQRHEEAIQCITEGLAACKGYVSSVEYTNLLKSFIDIKSKQVIPSDTQLATLLAKESRNGRPLENALRVSLIKNEEDIIYNSLQASYRVGIRYYAIADNSSTDNTKAEIARFSVDHDDCIVFIIDDPILAYIQPAKTMGLARFAITVLEGYGTNIEWIFPLDADECIYVADGYEDLHALLRSDRIQDRQMIVYHFCNASTRTALDKLDRFANLDSVFIDFASYRHRPVRKVAFRYSERCFLEYGNHYCNNCIDDIGQVIIGSEFGIFLKHYPIRSLHQFRSKVVNGGKSIASVASEGIGAHWRRDYRSFLELGDDFIVKRVDGYHAITRDFTIESSTMKSANIA